jgi:cytochrome b6-f complex iron-sulfur subunit
MSNYHVEPVDKPQALTTEAIKALRHEQVQGVSRRELLRGSLAAAVGLWLLEISAGTINFLWPNLKGQFGGDIEIGTFNDLKADNSELPVDQGFPVFVSKAKAFVMLIDTNRQAFIPGGDDTGDGHPVNVRALYQRCPHLGCKPNPCLKNFWLECPCHGSRYDRLGQKVAGEQYGPAPRSMDRFAVKVDGNGVLTINTGKITLGPLPIALGQPGVIPPRSPTGCIQ